jgi:hypothetical protein
MKVVQLVQYSSTTNSRHSLKHWRGPKKIEVRIKAALQLIKHHGMKKYGADEGGLQLHGGGGSRRKPDRSPRIRQSPPFS